MTGPWTEDWAWGLFLIALTLVLHAAGLVVIGIALGRVEARLWSRHSRRPLLLFAVALIIGGTGWMLAVLHGIEAALWAWAYLLLGGVDTLADAMLYSVDSITTRGASGLRLAHQWRMMGALEAADGMLLFGISTAFLFTVLERVWRRLAQTTRAPAPH